MQKNTFSSANFADTKPHYELLDGLRGVAAILVLFYHIFEGFSFAEVTNGAGDGIIRTLNHGHIAVDFFFILSGFVISYAYDDRWNKMNTWQFFKRRLIRLHPMLIMGAIIGCLAFASVGFERWDGTTAPTGWVMTALLLTMFMIPAVPGLPYEVRGNGEMFPLNGPCWSLFFEYIGNIVYALLIRRLSTRLLSLLTVALCCTLTWFAVTDQSGYGSIGVGWTVDSMNMLGGSLRMLCPFTAGALLSRVFKPFNNVRGAFWISAFVLLALFHVPFISSSFALGAGGGTLSLNGVFESVCIVAIFPLIVWLAASGKTTDVASTRICRFLGDISYPLYIVHYPLMYAFYRWLIKTEQYTLQETWYVALAVVVSSIVLAWLCLKIYDEPVRKWLANVWH